MEQAQRLNVAVYWITWSPFLQPFTVKNKTVEDLKPIAERRRFTDCSDVPTWLLFNCKKRPDETPVPYQPGPGGNLYALGELARLRLPDLSKPLRRHNGWPHSLQLHQKRRAQKSVWPFS